MMSILSKITSLFRNPMIMFVYGIISKWYIMVMITALVVTFWVFKGLTDTGILSSIEHTVSKAFSESKAIARYCIPKITNFGDFWQCLDNPPSYKETKDEIEFKEGLSGLLQSTDIKQEISNWFYGEKTNNSATPEQVTNPYDE